MKDYSMRNRSPSATESGHEAKLHQKKHKSTTFWWDEDKPGGRPDTYTRPKGEVGGGNSQGSGPGPRVA
jgi:hypothetical protein